MGGLAKRLCRNGKSGKIVIRLYANSEIDKAKWDSCVVDSNNALIYAYSWYLDIVSPNWVALIKGDYKVVFPLPAKKKLGVSYISQPLFTQQLGLFSSEISNNVDTFLHIYSSNRMEIKHIPPRSNLDVNIGISANTLQELGDKLLIEPKKKNFNSSIQQQDYNMSELYSYAAFSTNFHVLVINWTRVQDVLQKIGRIGIEKLVGKDLKVKKELTLHVGPADEELNMRTYPVGEIFTVGEDCVCDGKVCLDIGAEELCLDAAKFKEHFEEVEENFDSDDSSAGEKDEKDEAEGEGDESPIEEDQKALDD